jgi:DNA repair protein RecO (recombination protein O)
MEWVAPAIVLDAKPFGEGDAVVAVLTDEHGRHRGLARGGGGRSGAAIWQQGNLVQARWVGRLADQLGSFGGELVHPAAALVLDDPLLLAVLSSACAVAEGVLPEREPFPRSFAGLLQVIARLASGPAILSDYVRWESQLLTDLGFGLDLTRCAVTSRRENLVWVSPKTGCAVCEEAAGEWKSRLLKLPAFLVGEGEAGPAEWADGLRLTGHFLARDAFGSHHRPLPQARVALLDRVQALALRDGARGANDG